METVTNQSEQQNEVSLRTLSSDIKSVEHGATIPISESLKVAAQAIREEDSSEQPAGAPRKTGHTILLLIILVAIAAAGYFYIYPMLLAALSTPTTVN